MNVLPKKLIQVFYLNPKLTKEKSEIFNDRPNFSILFIKF